MFPEVVQSSLEISSGHSNLLSTKVRKPSIPCCLFLKLSQLMHPPREESCSVEPVVVIQLLTGFLSNIAHVSD
jgi:hypothetical protein